MYKTGLVGILNITPDSFSDGGEFFDPESAVNYTKKLIEEGADVIDIGAESTRPGAKSLTAQEELDRIKAVLPEIIKITNDNNCVSSLDTRHAESTKYAIDCGIGWINDVSGSSDTAMIEAIANSDVKFVTMHSLTIPADKNVILPEGTDAVEFLIKWFKDKSRKLEKAGIAKNRIIFDPGIGFGKNAEQSIDILKRIKEFKKLDVEILVGHSRKSFIHAITGIQDPLDRDIETLVTSLYLAENKVDYVRVHNVDIHQRAMNIYRRLF